MGLACRGFGRPDVEGRLFGRKYQQVCIIDAVEGRVFHSVRGNDGFRLLEGGPAQTRALDDLLVAILNRKRPSEIY